MIELLAGQWLWGMAGLGLPVAAHFLTRRGGRKVVFPTVRFVREAEAQRGRRTRLRQYLLLALRCMVVALVVLAFARPVFFGGRGSGVGGQGEEVVIVLDASASMTRAWNLRPIFDSARDEALALLDSLDPARDRAAVIVARREARAILPRMSANFDALRRWLKEAEATFERADLAAAVALAKGLSGEVDGARRMADGGWADDEAARPRRIHIFTDGQRTQLADLSPDTAMRIHIIGPRETTANAALFDPAISSPRPSAGRPATVSVRVGNYSERTVTRAVSLTTPTQRLVESITLEPGMIGSVSFRPTFREAGLIECAVEMPSDDFAADDRVEFAVAVRAQQGVALLTRADVGRDASSAAYYLHAALAPDDAAPIELTTLDSARDAADVAVLSRFDAVVLCEAGRLDGEWIEALREYVNDGGGLWWVLDSAQSADSLTEFAGREELGAIRAIGPQTVTLAHGDVAHPALALFDGPSASELRRQSIVAHARIEPTPQTDMLLWSEDGEAMLTSSDFGQGRLIVLNGALDARSSVLPRSPLFPVLAHELIAYAQRPGEASRSFVVGEPITLNIERHVGRLRVEPELPLIVTPADEGAVVSVGPAARPVLVRLMDDDGLIAAATVMLNPHESDLRPVDSRMLARLAGRADEDHAQRAGPSSAPAGLEEDLARGRRPVELWPLCIVLALALLGVESFTAGYSSSSPMRKRGAFAS